MKKKKKKKKKTPNLEPLLQPLEEENEQGIAMEKEVLVQTSKTATSGAHVQELLIHASKTKEAMNDNAKHCEEQGNESYCCSRYSQRKPRCHLLGKSFERYCDFWGRFNSDIYNVSNQGFKNSRSYHQKEAVAKKEKRTRASMEAINVSVPPTNTFSPTTSIDLNEVWELTLCIIKFYKNNIII